MADRTVQVVSRPSPIPGTGILRPYPSRALSHLDPFVFLDVGAPAQLGDRVITVDPHPHMGVAPVSLLFRGHVSHRDSLGNHTTVAAGGMQWFFAGRGALHEERVRGDQAGVFHMAQLWVNAPEAHKGDAPWHATFAPQAIPHWRLAPGVMARLYCGDLGNKTGPATPLTPMCIVHLVLDAGARVQLPAMARWNAGITGLDDQIQVCDDVLAAGDTVGFAHDGDTVTVHSDTGGQALFLAGDPIGEPVVYGAGFVATSKAAIGQAFIDHQAGRMGTLAGYTQE